MDAVCRFVQGKRKAYRRPYLCFDEWNVWYKTFNREGMDLTVEVADRSIALLESAELLTGADAKAANSFAAPDVIQSEVFKSIEVRGGGAHVSLPPLSLLAATLELEG